jgi:ankyrin repeat protein
MVFSKIDITVPQTEISIDFFTKFGLAVYFSKYGNNFNIVCENIEFQDINLQDNRGLTPLHIAVIQSNNHSMLKTLELILNYNPNIEIKNGHRDTALLLCCKYINLSSSIETMKILLEHNACINVSNLNNNTPLMNLVENNNLKAIKILLKYGVKMHIRNNNNESVLNISIRKYKFNSEITQTLLNYDKFINYKFSNYSDLNFIYKN